MSQPEDAVIEFGPAERGELPPGGRRGSLGALLASLARDRRLVPLTAGLGALAVFASLVSEWQVTTFDSRALNTSESGARPFPVTVAGVTGWGPAYLVGLFLLVTAVVITLFGPPAGRLYARLAALSSGGLLLVVVAAAYSALKSTTQVLGQLEAVGFSAAEMRIAVGRGVWCALAGVILLTLAAFLKSSREDDEPAPAWPWRRPAAEEEDWRPATPFELEVAPVKPWPVAGGGRDEATEGISG